MKRLIPVAVGALLVSLPALAEVKGNVGLYYDLGAETDLLGSGGAQSDGDGFGLWSGWNFGGPTAHFEYRTTTQDIDNSSPTQEEEIKTWRLGGGYRFALSDTVGIEPNLEYIDMEDDFASGGLVVESDGFGLHVAADFMPAQHFAAGLSLGYLMLDGESAQASGTDLSSDGLEYNLWAAYIINEMFSAGAMYRVYDGEFGDCGAPCGPDATYEHKGLMIGGQYSFAIK